MTLLLLVLVNSKYVVIQFFTVVPGYIPVFHQQFKQFNQFLGFSRININNQIHIFFHMCPNIP